MMDKLIEIVSGWIASNARRPAAQGAGGVLAGCICLRELTDGHLLAATVPMLLASTAVGLAVAVGIRWFARRPRAPKGCLGVLVALRCDDGKHARTVEADFVASLRHLLHDSPGAAPKIRLVVYGARDAAELTDADAVREAMDESRCHLALWGQVRVRPVNGAAASVISLHGLIRHAQVDDNAQRQLSTHFAGVLPEHYLLSEDGGVFKFQVASQHVDAVARYLMGVAALASRDLDTSERLLQDARARAAARTDACLRLVFERSTVHLAAIHSARCRLAYAQWLQTGDRSAVLRAHAAAQRALEFAPDAYDALLAGALCAFESARDVAGAHQLLRRCGNLKLKHAAWRYSTAFLHAYAGNIDRAGKEYGRAFKAPPQEPEQARALARECVAHITRVLREEPDRVGLHYAVARIAAGPLDDPALASEHALAFCAACPVGAHAAQRAAMQALVRGEVVSLPSGSLQPSAPTRLPKSESAAAEAVERRGSGRSGEAA